MTRHFLKDDDLSSSEQAAVITHAIELKANRFLDRSFEGPKSVALIFDKTSTRTRVSFSVGVSEMGGYPMLIDSQSSQLAKSESIADTARVLGKQVSQIMWRTFAQSNLEEMADYAGVPVISGLSDDYHPCQLLADLQTITEHFGKTEGMTVAYVGDGANNIANSYLLAGAIAGMNIRIAAPAGYQPDESIVARARELAKGEILITSDPQIAVKDADVVTTDTWVSMGMEDSQAKRIADLEDYRVDEKLFNLANQDAIFLHCLPAYRGNEVTAEVIDGERSLIWQQAENRLHAQKALMSFLANNH
ncbi:MAG: ornithine carbamoyltransferase [Microbacteriaceae bacterium]|nr:ornithine carbamoyltransferase [Microbacteriaceae bacterium]